MWPRHFQRACLLAISVISLSPSLLLLHSLFVAFVPGVRVRVRVRVRVGVRVRERGCSSL